jgi:CRP/FNR family transcriptional regulator
MRTTAEHPKDVDSGSGLTPPPPQFLYTHSILADLLTPHLQRLRQDAKSLALRDGEALFHMGDPADGCYWVRRGFLKFAVASTRGEERILAVVGPDAIVGDLALLDGSPRGVNCHALSEAHVLHIGSVAVRSCLDAHPNLHEHLVAVLTAQLWRVTGEAVVGTFLSVRGRVARALLKLAASVGRNLPDGLSEISCPVRHSDIAAMASATRESVSRLLGEWRRDKLLGVSADGKLIIDKGRLEKEVAQEA